MSVTLKQVVKFSSTTSASTSTYVTTADILVGEDIFIVAGRANAGATVCGISNISTSAGAGTFERVATSCRASTFDLTLSRFRCTTLIPSGSTITATFRAAAAKRGSVMQVVSGLTSAAAHKSSGNAADNQLGNTNAGDNGSSTAAASSTSAATIPDCLIIGGFAEGGTNTFSSASGSTKIDESRTTSGTADRGAGMFYKIVSATGVQTLNASVSPSGSWAGVVGAFEIDETPPVVDPPVFKEWTGSAWVTRTPKEWNGSAWVTLTPKEL